MPEDLVTIAEIAAARERIGPYVLRTPTLPAPEIGERLGIELGLKAELFQRTGSFKVRGVMNKVLSLRDEERRRGLSAFSAGNHAAAVAWAASRAGLPALACMPASAVPFKVAATRAHGAEVELVEGDLVARCLELTAARGLVLVNPFDDRAVIAGAGTVGLEIAEDVPEIDLVVVPVGGGGLISGVAAVLKRLRPSVRVIGVEPEAANVVSRSLRAEHPVPLPAPRSLADGLTAPVTGEINLAHVRALVDGIVELSEEEVLAGLHAVVRGARLAAEPAGAVGVAALLAGKVSLRPGERVVTVVTGGNANLELYGRLNSAW